MPHRLLSIGAFSRATGLSVKTLRLYHERGLLVPSSVDEQTGYRYYAPGQTERAAVIRTLRELEFPLDDIGAMLAVADDDADVLAFLESQRERIESRLQELRRVKASLDLVIRREQKVKRMNDGTFEVTEKTLDPMLVGGIRTRGRYADIGPLFGQLGRKLGRHIRGKALGLYYDESYREENADFEACMPLKRRVTTTGVDVRELRAVARSRCSTAGRIPESTVHTVRY